MALVAVAEAVEESVATVAVVLPAVLPVEVPLAVVTASLVAVPVVDLAVLPPSTPPTTNFSPNWAATKSSEAHIPCRILQVDIQKRPEYRLTENYMIVILGIRPAGITERRSGAGHLAGRGDRFSSICLVSTSLRLVSGRSSPHLKSKKCISPSLIQLKLVTWRPRLAVCVIAEKSLVASLVTFCSSKLCDIGKWCKMIWCEFHVLLRSLQLWPDTFPNLGVSLQP